MSKQENVYENIENVKENVKENIEIDEEIKKIKRELFKKFEEYKKTINYMATDAPIEILCLPKKIEKILLDQGFLRVYDLFDVDFVKIKGLGKSRIRDLTSCLDQFFSML